MFSFSKREKIFGAATGAPLDSPAKARIVAHARAWSQANRQPGQHRGPLTRATIEVLATLLYRFHNAHTGACFPGLDKLAEAAQCHRSTAHAAIVALEAAGVLTWVHRLKRISVRVRDAWGRLIHQTRVLRTSNGYSFRDPCPPPSTSENRAGTPNQGILELQTAPLDAFAGIDKALGNALRSWGASISARDAVLT